MKHKKKKSSKWGILLIGIFLVLSQVLYKSNLEASSSTSWMSIKPKSGAWSVSFPSAPEVIRQSVPITEEGDLLHYDVYIAPLSEKSLCLFLEATYPFELKQGKELEGIEGLLSGILGQNPDNQLKFAKLVEHDGVPGMDFLIHSKGAYFRGKALMQGNKLFLIAIEGKNGQVDEASFSKFSQSFSFEQSAALAS
jgi:hypothetical protein